VGGAQLGFEIGEPAAIDFAFGDFPFEFGDSALAHFGALLKRVGRALMLVAFRCCHLKTCPTRSRNDSTKKGAEGGGAKQPQRDLSDEKVHGATVPFT
jgi:hypothetical protein